LRARDAARTPAPCAGRWGKRIGSIRGLREDAGSTSPHSSRGYAPSVLESAAVSSNPARHVPMVRQPIEGSRRATADPVSPHDTTVRRRCPEIPGVRVKRRDQRAVPPVRAVVFE